MQDLQHGKEPIPTQKGALAKERFIEATKQIIQTEGAEHVTARSVAEIAGYSYATIYHYFDDLGDLLLAAKESLMQDVALFMNADTDNIEAVHDVNDVKRLNRAYAQYYLDHPHVFRFFYFYRTNEETSLAVECDFRTVWHETYKTFVKNGTINESDVEALAKSIIYTLHGMLALYFSDNGLTKESIFRDLDSITEFLLRDRSKT